MDSITDDAPTPEMFSEQEQEPAPQGRGISSWLGWSFVVFGVCLAAVSGIVLTRAWFTKDIINGWIGAFLFIGGTLVAVSGGMRTRDSARDLSGDAPVPRDSVIPREPGALPRLGELLVYKYHMITEKDLQRALVKQREFAGRPLGEILVEMGRISWRDLAKTLEDQLSYGDPWQRKRK